ncbi:hypothetical protein OCU04_012772 [Sclerotinia nivalis]|uniref:Uncharacterized protein n=1 Tax=Sclerotinia nivalis TaxID=352851 RepID=A0A9X0A994_9HELO|nr:hypothetical protein OCU04_012772 [Sclerotinia nivalis]
MPRLPCERFFQNSVPQVGRDVMQVHRMRCGRRSKGKNIFEYLVDELSAWLSRAESKIHPKHPATPINDNHRHTPSAPPGPARSGDPNSGKRGEKAEAPRHVTPMTITTPAKLAMKTHDLQSDESHALSLPRLQPSAASIPQSSGSDGIVPCGVVDHQI